MKYAPIALFVYNRPLHTEQTLNALKNAELANESILYIFLDGPKNDEAKPKVNEVREIIKREQWTKEVVIIENGSNFGLSKSILNGINQIFKIYSRIIVLEDDLIIDNQFLKFINFYLDEFENDMSVIQINGYMFGNLAVNNKVNPFLMNFVSTWGWGTWKDKWQKVSFKKLNLFEKILLMINKNAFNLNNSYDYYTLKLKKDKGLVQSWGVDLWYYAFKKNKMSVFPPKSLVKNIGFDGSGTNGGSKKELTSNDFGKVIITKKENVVHLTIVKQEIEIKLKSNELEFV